jgi:hypothetical protein
MTIPAFCIHRTPVEGVEGSHIERAEQGMKVIYWPTPHRPEVGVIQQVDARSAFVLYLGDRTAKSTVLDDLTLWEGP